MRIRIALTTAIAVIAGMTTGIFTLSISHQPASAQAAATHHTTHTGAKATLSHTRTVGLRRSQDTSSTTSTHRHDHADDQGGSHPDHTRLRPPGRDTAPAPAAHHRRR